MWVIQRGYLAGMPFELEGAISDVMGIDSLQRLVEHGNMAAMVSISRGKYTQEDAPFYYGKIENLGYIVSHDDLYGISRSK